jgi:hypothetical protein
MTRLTGTSIRPWRPRFTQKEAAVPTYDQPTLGWTVVLRRQPVRIVKGQPEGGYTDAYELVCCECGDHPDLDYREIPAELRRIRGPYTFAVGIGAYGEHVRLQHSPQSVREAGYTRRRRGSAHAPANPGGGIS